MYNTHELTIGVREKDIALMGDNSTIQSLVRGMRILELLSENGRMTATDIAKEIGIHQSSASRLLNSLAEAGMVHKPKFKSFSLDYGVLLFAGKTLHHFPLVSKATLVCDRLVAAHPGYSATVGTLFRNRLIYLTTVKNVSSLMLIDNPDFPIHMSSLGRTLAYRQGRKKALEIFEQSLGRCPTNESARSIYDKIDASIRKHGFMYMENEYHNKFNAACCFTFQDKEACLAVYSETVHAKPENLHPILDSGIADIKKDEFN
jgi:DNA-binding IclR family transcriptional regulator